MISGFVASAPHDIPAVNTNVIISNRLLFQFILTKRKALRYKIVSHEKQGLRKHKQLSNVSVKLGFIFDCFGKNNLIMPALRYKNISLPYDCQINNKSNSRSSVFSGKLFCVNLITLYV